MEPKFGNSSISKDLTRKKFLSGSLGLKLNNLGLILGMALKPKFYVSVAKGLKLSQKVLRANYYVCRSYTPPHPHPTPKVKKNV